MHALYICKQMFMQQKLTRKKKAKSETSAYHQQALRHISNALWEIDVKRFREERKRGSSVGQSDCSVLQGLRRMAPGAAKQWPLQKLTWRILTKNMTSANAQHTAAAYIPSLSCLC